jgi:hypothetical protein
VSTQAPAPKLSHPALPLLRLAETTPALPYTWQAAHDACAVASQTEPESLPPTAIFRLALRFAEVLWTAKQLDRAETWLGVAERDGQPDVSGRAELAILRARLAVTRCAPEPTPMGSEAPFAEALAQARKAAEAASPAPSTAANPPPALAARLALLEAEAAVALPPLLAHPGRLHRIDDLWRVQRLLAFAHQARLNFELAAPLYAANAELAEQHEAPLDAAESLLAEAQCRVALDEAQAAHAALTRAAHLAPPDSVVFRAVAGGAALLALAEGRPDEALARAHAAAVEAAQADQHRAYVELVTLATHIRRILGQHAQAFREVLSIYSQLNARLGPEGAAPMLTLIEHIQRDLGPQAFEALSAQILAEQTSR